MLNSPQQRAIFNTKNYMLLRHKDSYAAPLAKTVFSLPFVVICNSAGKCPPDLDLLHLISEK